MKCSEKACVLSALTPGGLCRHHTLMLGGDWAFASHGCRMMGETISEREQKLGQKREIMRRLNAKKRVARREYLKRGISRDL